MASKTRLNTSLRIAKFILHLLINMALYLIIIYIALKVGKLVYDTSYEIFGNQGVAEENGIDVYVRINPGETTMNVASKLEQNKVIDNKISFYIHAKVKEYPIMPGTFTLNTSMNYDDIFAVITTPVSAEELEELEGPEELEELDEEENASQKEEDATQD